MPTIYAISVLGSLILIPLLASIVIIFYVWYRDKYEREPLLLVLKMFIWGATSAVFMAIILEYLAIYYMLFIIPPEIASTLSAVIIAPIAEEYAKGRGIMFIQNSEEYDGMMDGIVYGVAIGAGFGFTENVLYGLDALVFGGLLAAILTIVLRSSLEIAGHPFYTSWIGSEVGLEKKYGIGGFSKGYLVAIVFHAIWNSIALIGTVDELLSLCLLIIVVFIYVSMFRKRIRMALKYEQKEALLET